MQALFNWTTYGAEEIDRAEKERWRRAEEVYERRQAGAGADSTRKSTDGPTGQDAAVSSSASADTSPSVKQEWRRSVGFDATTSPGATGEALPELPTPASTSADPDAADADEQRRIRYSQIATEILTADIQSVVQTAVDGFERYMSGLFNAVLPPLEHGASGEEAVASEDAAKRILRIDEPAMRRLGAIRQIKDERWDENEEKDERRRETIRSNWARVCGVYMGWRSAEVS